MECALEFGELDGEGVRVEQGAQVGECQGDALDEVGLALVEAAIAVGAEGLEDADEDVGPEVAEPLLLGVACDAADGEVVGEQVEAQGFGEVALGGVEQRGDIILCGAAAAALVVDVE